MDVADTSAAVETRTDAGADARVEDVPAIEVASSTPTSCETTRTDDACFDCCDAKFPNAFDVWDDAMAACCPDDEVLRR